MTEDTWVKIEEGIATLGIKKESAEKVEEFMFVKLPEVGAIIKKGDVYVSLEAIKWSGHLESPVSGKVIEVNESVYDEPSLINSDSESAWICKIQVE